MFRQILILIISIFLCGGVVAQDAEVDLLVQNAHVVDGTGSPWFRSDVAIDDGHIVGVGFDLNVNARQIIDAAGRVLAPGFVADFVLFDPETVADAATFEDPHQYSVGFDYVIVNGVPVVADGAMTDERSGQCIKGAGAR